MDMSFLYGACGGGVVGVVMVIFGWFAYAYFQRVLAERDQLLAAKNAATDKQINDLSGKLETHIKEDRSQELLNEMKHVNGTLEKLTAQVERALEKNSEQSAKIENHTDYIANLRDDLQSHIRDTKGR